MFCNKINCISFTAGDLSNSRLGTLSREIYLFLFSTNYPSPEERLWAELVILSRCLNNWVIITCSPGLHL